MMNDIDLDSKMEDAIRKGGLAELVKMNIRHCVTQCNLACGVRIQHEERLNTIEKRLNDDVDKLDNIASVKNFAARFPRWTYPIILITAIFAGLSLPFMVMVYLILVSKGIMPKIW